MWSRRWRRVPVDDGTSRDTAPGHTAGPAQVVIARLRNLLHYGLGLMAGMLGVSINFLMQVMLTRYLGTAGFGQFALWRNNVHLASAFGTLSVQTLALKDVSHPDWKADPGRVTAFLLAGSALVIAVSTVAALVIVMPFSPPRFGFVAALVAVNGLGLLAFWAATNRAFSGGVAALVLERAGQPFFFASLAAAALFGLVAPDLADLGWGYAAASALALAIVIALAATIWRHGLPTVLRGETGLRAHGNTPPAIARRAIPFFLISIASFLSARSPLFVAGFILAPDDLGRLAFMISLAGLVSVLLFSVNLVAGPRIAHAFSAGEPRKAQAEVRKVRWLAGGLGTVTAGLLFATAPLVERLAGAPGLIVEPAFALLLAGGVVTVLLSPAALYLQMTDGQATLARLLNAGVALKVVLLYPLGRHFGIEGIAVAEVVQSVMVGLAVAIIYHRLTRRET